MWKKFREASAGVTLNSVTNLFRNKSYSKFGSRDDLFENQGQNEDVKVAIDEENNYVSWHEESRQLEKVTPPRRFSTSSENSVSDSEDFGFSNEKVQSSSRNWTNSDEKDTPDLNRSRILSHRSQNGHILNPKTEVKEMVQGFAQRRYQQLEDSDDSHDGRTVNLRSQSSDSDIENNVFNTADDVHPKQTTSKTKKTKKVQFFKLFRRMPCVPSGNQTSLR